MQSFDYLFNIGGNYSATINGITEATGRFSVSVEGARSGGQVTGCCPALFLAGLRGKRHADEGQVTGRCPAYALMSNHFHLLLHAKNDTVSFITAYVEKIGENACRISLFYHFCITELKFYT